MVALLAGPRFCFPILFFSFSCPIVLWLAFGWVSGEYGRFLGFSFLNGSLQLLDGTEWNGWREDRYADIRGVVVPYPQLRCYLRSGSEDGPTRSTRPRRGSGDGMAPLVDRQPTPTARGLVLHAISLITHLQWQGQTARESHDTCDRTHVSRFVRGTQSDCSASIARGSLPLAVRDRVAAVAPAQT